MSSLASRQKGDPRTVLVVTVMLFLLNVAGYFGCRSQHQHYSRLQAQIEASPLPAADEESLPNSNRPRGQLSGVTGWAVFYGELAAALLKVLWVSGFFVLFGVIWVRAPRSG